MVNDGISINKLKMKRHTVKRRDTWHQKHPGFKA